MVIIYLRVSFYDLKSNILNSQSTMQLESFKQRSLYLIHIKSLSQESCEKQRHLKKYIRACEKMAEKFSQREGFVTGKASRVWISASSSVTHQPTKAGTSPRDCCDHTLPFFETDTFLASLKTLMLSTRLAKRIYLRFAYVNQSLQRNLLQVNLCISQEIFYIFSRVKKIIVLNKFQINMMGYLLKKLIWQHS